MRAEGSERQQMAKVYLEAAMERSRVRADTYADILFEARLQDEHGHACILGEPCRSNAARAASTHNNVCKCVRHASPISLIVGRRGCGARTRRGPVDVQSYSSAILTVAVSRPLLKSAAADHDGTRSPRHHQHVSTRAINNTAFSG